DGTVPSPAAKQDDLIPQLETVLSHIRDGDYPSADAAASQIPGKLGQILRDLIQHENQRWAELQRLASRCIVEGAKPLLAANDLADQTRIQNEQVSQLAAVAEEMSASVHQVAANAEQVSQGAQEALDQVSASIERIQSALDGMIRSG